MDGGGSRQDKTRCITESPAQWDSNSHAMLDSTDIVPTVMQTGQVRRHGFLSTYQQPPPELSGPKPPPRV